MKSIVKGGILGLGLGLLTAGELWAQLPPNLAFKWWTHAGVVRELDLDENQRQQIESVWREHRKTLIDLRAEHDKHQIDLNALINGQDIDEVALAAKVDQVYQAKAEVEKVTLQMRLKIRNVLTPAQRARSTRLFERLMQEERRRRQQNEMNPAQGQRPRDRRPPPRNSPPSPQS